MLRNYITFLAVITIGTNVIWGQDENVLELPPIVVTGTRLIDEPFDQPYAFYRVSTDELQNLIGRTALDRMNYGAGVFVQRTSPNQASPFIRGLTGEQTLLMLDGIRFSHAMMRPGPNQYSAMIPDYSLSSIDAILGASSTVNGSDGLTGALDFRLAPAGRGLDSMLSAWGGTRVDTGNGATVNGGIDGVNGDWAYSFDFGLSDFHNREGGDDFRDHLFGENVRSYDDIPNTGYDAYSGGMRLAYLGLADHILELSSGYSRQTDAPRPDGYAENTGRTDRIYRFYDPQELTFIHLKDSWVVDSTVIERLNTKLWWHQHAEEQFRSSVLDQGAVDERIRQREYDDMIDAFGIDIQATTLLGAEDAHELIWGGTYIYESTKNSYREYRTPAGLIDLSLLAPYNQADWDNNTSVSDDSTYESIGLFIQDDWQVVEQFSILIGARYSNYRWSFGEVNGDADDFTGGLRCMWAPVDNHRFFVGISQGFRAPNLRNLDGVVDRGSNGQPATGNPELDPETSLTYEAGWKWLEERNSVSLTVFHTEIDDFIQPNYADGGQVQNVEGADLYGFECAWDYGIGIGSYSRLALVGSTSLVDATRDIPIVGGTFEDNISRANRLYGRAGLKYEYSRNWWTLLQIRWHDTYDDVATYPGDSDADDVRLTVAGNPDGSMPGYGIVDFLVGWLNNDGTKHVNLFIENIGNRTYREPGSGADGVGLNIGLNAGVRF